MNTRRIEEFLERRSEEDNITWRVWFQVVFLDLFYVEGQGYPPEVPFRSKHWRKNLKDSLRYHGVTFEEVVRYFTERRR